MDSDIAERVLLTFAKHEDRIPILPLHDSFILHWGYEDMLRRVMAEAFERVVGGPPKISMDTYLAPTATDDEFMDLSLEALLAANDVGHEWRLLAFKR
jgi:hypothetical protein